MSKTMEAENAPLDTLPTPFAQHSWQGRFAIDGNRNAPELLLAGLRCCLALKGLVNEEPNDTFTAYTVSPNRLAIAIPRDGRPYPLNADLYFTNESIEAAAHHIHRWLRDIAKYPKRPWFDGGEEKGFQMFHVPPSSGYELYQGYQRYTLIETKWFEVHK